MPRGFTERERETIRNRLLEKGRAYFGSYGIRKTNVEDLTKAAGISKGSFYRFYDSKEELFFDIFEEFETEFRATVFEHVLEPGTSPRQSFKYLLKKALSAWKNEPLFRNLDREEYAYLLRKVPEEKVHRHLRNDESFVAELIDRWKREGVVIDSDPKMASGLIRALFFVSLHEDDIGTDVYPGVLDLLLDLVAQHLVKE